MMDVFHSERIDLLRLVDTSVGSILINDLYLALSELA